MAKQQKIKRYTQKQRTFKAGPRPLGIVITAILLIGLVGIGMAMYNPIMEFAEQILNPPVVGEPEIIAELPPPPSSSEESSQPLPPPQPETPEEIRAILMPLETAKYQSLWDAFVIEMPENTNTVMVELKSSEGIVNASSTKTAAAEWEAVAENPINLEMLADYLETKGYSFAVRIAAFADPYAARALRANGAIMHGSGLTWMDNTPERGGRQWLNPYAAAAREYIVDLAVEAAEAGAAFVLLDRVQFPSDPTGTATYGETGGVTKHEILKAFTAEIKTALEPYGTRVAIYLSAGTLERPEPAGNTIYYGGSPIEFGADEMVLGMNLDFVHGATIEEKLQGAMRAKELADNFDVKIIPVITAREDAPHSKQIEIIEALGFAEYILY